MAQGDITKKIVCDKIEVVNTWNIQVRQATVIMEEQTDGSTKQLSRSFNRYVLEPFTSQVDSDNKWTHTTTDLSSQDATVKAIAEAAWTDAVKTAYKTKIESQTTP